MSPTILSAKMYDLIRETFLFRDQKCLSPSSHNEWHHSNSVLLSEISAVVRLTNTVKLDGTSHPDLKETITDTAMSLSRKDDPLTETLLLRFSNVRFCRFEIQK